MKRIIVFCVDKFRRLKHYVSSRPLECAFTPNNQHINI